MLLRDLKRQMLLSQQEYGINQRATIRGLEAHVLSFTTGVNGNCLWMAYRDEVSEQAEEPAWREFHTNRQELLQDIEVGKRNIGFHISEMEIQGQRVSFASSSSHRIDEMNVQRLMQLQHFAEHDLLPAEWDGVELESIIIAQYEQAKGEQVIPAIDRTRDLGVVLYIDRSFREIPVQLPFVVPFGKQEPGAKVRYDDPLSGKERCFYIDETYSYDVYQEVLSNPGYDDAQMPKRARKQLMKALGSVCPQGEYLAVIKYETPDDVQLRFMLRRHLEQEPVRSNTGSAFGSISDPAAVGVNGHRLRECVLQPVDKGFSGELELELFSQWVEVPAEIVRCSVR